MMVWSETSVSECPACGATVAVGIMSLAATCACGFYYVDVNEGRGWYSSPQAYRRGDAPIPAF
jgi:hypothetical protein